MVRRHLIRVIPVMPDLAAKFDLPRKIRLQPGDHAQQGCLAGAGRPHDAQGFSQIHIQVEIQRKAGAPETTFNDQLMAHPRNTSKR